MSQLKPSMQIQHYLTTDMRFGSLSPNSILVVPTSAISQVTNEE